jgi:hypothetical protein
VREEPVIVRHLVMMESQRVPHARQNSLVWNVAAAIGNAQRSESEAGCRNRRHPAVVANSRPVESLRPIEHLTRIWAGLFQEKHARPSLEIIEEDAVFVRQLVGSGRNWSNLYLLRMRPLRQRW